MLNRQKQSPHYADTIIVPIANPGTAPHMLELAISLITGGGGEVLALTVAQEDKAAETTKAVEAIEEIVAEYNEKGDELNIDVRVVTQIAPSVTRGILDAVREYGADVLIMGMAESELGEVRLGSVVEDVMQAAACDVLLYRLSESPPFNRVIIPLDGTPYSLTALYTGLEIARVRQIKAILLYVRRYQHPPEYDTQINSALEASKDVTFQEDILAGQYPVGALVRRIGPDDLLLLGFERRDPLEREIGDDLTTALLNRAVGPVVVASRTGYRNRLTRTVQRQLQRFNPMLTDVERNEIVWQAQKNARVSIDYATMILLSAALASLGLLVNSTAVIIGAMLVAPLLQPIGAFSTGLVTGLLPVIRRSVLTMVEGVGLALVVALAVGFLLPFDLPTPEMLARGNPTLLDAAVAFFSGGVAAYAIARKGIPAALAGVAIAAALMPPLCVVGLAVVNNQQQLALGSLLLVSTNIAFIILAQAVVFLWVGMRPGRRQEFVWQTRAWWAILSLTLIGVVMVLFGLRESATLDRQIEQFLVDQFPDAEVAEIDIARQDDGLSVLVTLRTVQDIAPATVQAVEARLAEQLNRADGDLNLSIAKMQLVRAEDLNRLTIIETLETAVPDAAVTNLEVEGDAPHTLITATLRTPSSDAIDVAALQAALIEALDNPLVRLQIVVQQVLTVPTSASPTPATP